MTADIFSIIAPRHPSTCLALVSLAFPDRGDMETVEHVRAKSRKLPHWRTTLRKLGDATDTDMAWLRAHDTPEAAWQAATHAWQLAWMVAACGCGELLIPAELDPRRTIEAGQWADMYRRRIKFWKVAKALRQRQRELADKRGAV
jgi:hypothetical protein